MYILRHRVEMDRRKRGEPSGRKPPPLKCLDGAKAPESLVDRMTEMGLTDPDVAAAVPLLAEENGESLNLVLLCCPDWEDSKLHRVALRGEGQDAVPTPGRGGDLQACWDGIRESLGLLWRDLRIPREAQEAALVGCPAAASADGVYRLELHLKELIAYRAETLNIIMQVMQREQTMDRVRRTHVLALSDERLSDLKADLQKLDQLKTRLSSSIDAWGRRFTSFCVDRDRAPLGSRLPPPVFVWGGKDYVDVMHEDANELGGSEMGAQ